MRASLQMRNSYKKKPSRRQSTKPLIGIPSAVKDHTICLSSRNVNISDIIDYYHLVLSAFYM